MGGKPCFPITPFFASLEYPNTHNGTFNLLIFYGFPALFLSIAFGKYNKNCRSRCREQGRN